MNPVILMGIIVLVAFAILMISTILILIFGDKKGGEK